MGTVLINWPATVAFSWSHSVFPGQQVSVGALAQVSKMAEMEDHIDLHIYMSLRPLLPNFLG